MLNHPLKLIVKFCPITYSNVQDLLLEYHCYEETIDLCNNSKSDSAISGVRCCDITSCGELVSTTFTEICIGGRLYNQYTTAQ